MPSGLPTQANVDGLPAFQCIERNSRTVVGIAATQNRLLLLSAFNEALHVCGAAGGMLPEDLNRTIPLGNFPRETDLGLAWLGGETAHSPLALGGICGASEGGVTPALDLMNWLTAHTADRTHRSAGAGLECDAATGTVAAVNPEECENIVFNMHLATLYRYLRAPVESRSAGCDLVPAVRCQTIAPVTITIIYHAAASMMQGHRAANAAELLTLIARLLPISEERARVGFVTNMIDPTNMIYPRTISLHHADGGADSETVINRISRVADSVALATGTAYERYGTTSALAAQLSDRYTADGSALCSELPADAAFCERLAIAPGCTLDAYAASCPRLCGGCADHRATSTGPLGTHVIIYASGDGSTADTAGLEYGPDATVYSVPMSVDTDLDLSLLSTAAANVANSVCDANQPAPPQCVPGASDCHRCDDFAVECTFCRNGRYLVDGMCAAACPTGSIATGNGRFGLGCTRLPSGTGDASCIAGTDHCQRCADGSACTMCRDAHYLHGGTCHAACPAGQTPVGRGNFQRRCERHESCIAVTAHCETCTEDGLACAQCRDGRFLLDSRCVASCPEGSTAHGSGRFNRVCAVRAGCTRLRDNCHVCNGDSSACEKCRHSAYLSNGTCVLSCPEGSTPRGRGRYNRVCIL